MNGKMDRRKFMKSVAIAGGLIKVAPEYLTAATEGSTPRPDILLIMPDQMRGDCLSAVGHPAVRTPNLDKLAEKGALFRRAYTTTASCKPARYSLLTGLYPQSSGVVGFAVKPIKIPTMPELLTEAGYSTVLVGRNMHQHNKSGACGYQRRVLGSTYISNDDYDNFLRQQAPQTGGIRKLVKDMGLTYNYWQAKPWPLENRLHPTEWAIDNSRKVVQQAHPEKPLFLTASFYAPHPPLFPPKKYFDKYLKDELPEPAYGDWVEWDSVSPEGLRKKHRVKLQGQQLREAQAGYFGLIEHLDEQISSLIEDFKDRSTKNGRPWVIVFTADHGEMLGDHAYFRKCEPYEGSANIPFIICGSDSLGFEQGLNIERPVCLEDIMPTLLAFAGGNCPPDIDGVNLIPSLKGNRETIRPWLHFEHAPCYSDAQAFHAIHDGRFKYIWRTDSGTEHLFDLDRDPQELKDLSGEASYDNILKKLRKILIQRLAGRPEGFTKNGKLVSGQSYLPLIEDNS